MKSRDRIYILTAQFSEDYSLEFQGAYTSKKKALEAARLIKPNFIAMEIVAHSLNCLFSRGGGICGLIEVVYSYEEKKKK